MQRIVFLDVDGVLNHHLTEHRIDPFTADDLPGSGLMGMDPVCVKNLQTLVEKSGADIVLSSTWRKPPFGLGKAQRCARRQGYQGPRWLDVTPVGHPIELPTSASLPFRLVSQRIIRGREIQRWLDEHPFDGRREIVILDDDTDMDHLSNRLVLTNPYDGGLTEAKVREALKLFGMEA